MNVEINKILQEFIADTKSYGALLIDSKGDVIYATGLENDISVAAMGSAILSMCDKFLDDMEKGLLKLIVLRTTEGRVIFNKINISKTLVIFTKSDMPIGLLLHNVEEITEKLQKQLI